MPCAWTSFIIRLAIFVFLFNGMIHWALMIFFHLQFSLFYFSMTLDIQCYLILVPGVQEPCWPWPTGAHQEASRRCCSAVHRAGADRLRSLPLLTPLPLPQTGKNPRAKLYFIWKSHPYSLLLPIVQNVTDLISRKRGGCLPFYPL